MLVKTLQNLSIPREKNAIFVSPEPSEWSSLLAKNKSIVENLPNRLKWRSELFRIAQNYTFEITDAICQNNIPENIIATGHQAVWHHCGLWAKKLATSKFAKTVNATGLHLIIDHDIRDTAIVLPRQNAGESWYFERVEIESKQKAIPLELRPLPQGIYVKSFVNTVINARAASCCSDIWSKCADFESNITLRLNNIADLITHLQSVLNAALGLDMVYLPVSKLSQSEAFMNFVIYIMQDAAGFAASYNNAITKHINENKTNSKGTIQRLVLDKTTGLTILPFWLLSPNGKRTSVYAKSKKPNKITIGTVSAELGSLDSSSLGGKTDQLKNILEQLDYRLRPKAISLMLFTRLFLADWFIHGIGGALYEPITDYIIEDYYNVKPPKFGVATCTMTLPLSDGAAGSGSNIMRLKHKLHDIRHNPERHIDESILKTEPVASLLQAKQERIEEARDRTLPSDLRRSAWSSITKINERLFEYAKDTAKILKKEIMDSGKKRISQEVCNYREYFFGLFPDEKLRKLAESLTFAECKNATLTSANAPKI